MHYSHVVSEEQIEEVISAAKEIWPKVYSQMISPQQIDYMLDWMYSPRKIREEIADQQIFYWLVFDNPTKELAVGFCSFGPLVEDQSCMIHKLYIHPSCHRRGYGTLVLSEIERVAGSEAAAAIELRVNRENIPAIRLYESFGFDRVAEDCADIGGGFVMDDYIFRKKINNYRVN